MKTYLIILGFMICMPVICSGAVIHVPGDQPTIQAGIDAAVEGDTVLVSDGTYTGDGNKNLDYSGKAITVKSESGAGSCVIDCEGDGLGFVFQNLETRTSVLEGFTIRNVNTDEGGAIYCKIRTSPLIRNCIFAENSGAEAVLSRRQSEPCFENCQFLGSAGEGDSSYFVAIETGSDASFIRCTFQNSSVGIIGISNGSAYLEECIIQGIDSLTPAIITVYFNSASLTMENCSLVDTQIYCYGSMEISDTSGTNSSIYIQGIFDFTGTGMVRRFTGTGSHIFVSKGSRVEIIDSELQEGNIGITEAIGRVTNTQITGGNVYCSREGELEMDGCILEEFHAEDHSSVLEFDIDSVGYLKNCILRNNTGGSGGAIDCDHSVLTLENVTIENNSSLGYGGGIHCMYSLLNMSDCIFRNNYGTYGGGLYLRGTYGSMYNCLITGNAADQGGGAYLFSIKNDFFSIWNSTFTGNSAESGSGCELYNVDKLYVRNTVFWNAGESELSYYNEWDANFQYCCIRGEEIPGFGNITTDPLFTTGPGGAYYLSQRSAGQDSNSPCLDSGFDDAANICFGRDSTICIGHLTTRTDEMTDVGTADMGYHYTAASSEPGVMLSLAMPAHFFYPGDPCSLTVTINNTTSDTFTNMPLFVILNVYGTYYFYPSFSDFDYDPITIPPGQQQIIILDEFTWPEDTGSADDITWYSAITTTDFSTLFSSLDTWTFGWSE